MSARRTERLLNLLIALAATRWWLTKQQIRQAVPQYADSDSDEAFDRMFERDKEDLRDLGVPITTGHPDPAFDEVGYRIDQAAYRLPEIEFSAAELGMLSLAARLWEHAALSGPAARGLVKLKALGVAADPVLAGVQPRVGPAETVFPAIYQAVVDRRPIRFGYRGRAAQAGTRTVQPWRVTSHAGHWYLQGLDLDRQDHRSFRLSRIQGRIQPAGEPGSYRVPSHEQIPLPSGPAQEDPRREALVRLGAGRGHALRRRAGIDHDDECRARIAFSDVQELADQIAWHGPDAVALEPQDLVDAVVSRLRAAAALPIEGETR